MAEKTILKDEIKDKIKRPSMYKVIIYNDDYTTMDFVVEVIMRVFHKSNVEATKIMLDVHNLGRGIVGIYSYDIASSKISKVNKMARSEGFPLKLSMEEE
ncbi:MAG: ATP-dependent Clp protease adapter ClpS [Bacillota bacterium]|nr:ATP-dependent Clp protease adapter ClpS [Bacillota bacterium]